MTNNTTPSSQLSHRANRLSPFMCLILLSWVLNEQESRRSRNNQSLALGTARASDEAIHTAELTGIPAFILHNLLSSTHSFAAVRALVLSGAGVQQTSPVIGSLTQGFSVSIRR